MIVRSVAMSRGRGASVPVRVERQQLQRMNVMVQDPRNATAGVHQAEGPALTPIESAKVDARQDELMKEESPEGRPPTHAARVFGWRRLLWGGSALIVIAVVWSLSRGVTAHDVIGFAVAAALVLVLGAWPVMTAGLLRGKEEAKARKESIVELQAGKLR